MVRPTRVDDCASAVSGMHELTSASARAPDPAADRRFFVFNAVVSVAALLLLGWLLLVRRGAGTGGRSSASSRR